MGILYIKTVMRYILISLLILLTACASPTISQKLHKGRDIALNNSVDNNTYNKKIPPLQIDELTFSEIDINSYLFSDKQIRLNYDYVSNDELYDIAPVITPRVRYYIDRYSKKFPSYFQQYLERANKYIYLIKDTLRREGLPMQLAVLPFAESGFLTDAYSHMGAGGMWQFMPETGKIYGLKINYWVDERRDFEKATKAAAKHLKYLYENLGDWYLAIAAYNAGFYRVYYGVKKYNTNDFFKLAKTGYLKKETIDYVPKFIAFSILYYNYLEYGFEPPSTPPLFYEKINLNQPVNLYVIADLLNIDIDTLKELNPDLKKPITPPDDSYSLKVPYGMKDILKAKIANMSPQDLLKVKIYKAKNGEYVENIAKKFNVSKDNIMAVNGLKYSRILYDTYIFIPDSDFMQMEYAKAFINEIKMVAPKVHIVKSGENLYNIAHKYGLSLYDVISYNKGINPRLIRPGQAIIITPPEDTNKVALKKTAPKKKTNSGKYIVQKGDTLWKIANEFNTSVEKIMKKNNLKTATLMPGDKLIVAD
jgi:membrane-bound lytic murein transglycosylase D